jgi:polyhydroxyalkanoate synthase
MKAADEPLPPTASESTDTESDSDRFVHGANPLIGLNFNQTVRAAGRWAASLGRHPKVLGVELAKWTAAEAKVIAGSSPVRPDRKDKRFDDSAWDTPVWRRVSQSYLVTRDGLLGSVDRLDLDRKSADRARFALSQLTEAAAPTNNLFGNPAALKKAAKTRGRSLRDGGRHFLYDLRHNDGMPSQVDTRPFRVGENIAVTPGTVIHRTEMFELIQYTPQTPKVYARPTVILPPQINRYYFLDIAPGRSFTEYSVGRGIQTFLISWRNPGPEQKEWDLDDYASAALEAMRVAAEITKSEQVNVIGFCAGGMTESAILSHLSAMNDDLVGAASLAVTMMDTEVSSTLNMFASERSVKSATDKSARKGVLEGKSLGKVFALMRPNDLIWNYWVSNYLLGNNPPAFDVLAWNSDATNLPAGLHADFMQMFVGNTLVKPGSVKVLGTPVDLRQVKIDLYVVGALTDHLVPWQSAYAATQAFGGDVRYILSNSGHIQALINPPGNPKATFYHGEVNPPDAADWLASATKASGSWWEDWATWSIARSGAHKAKPRSPGNRAHPVVEIAPGRYVRE